MMVDAHIMDGTIDHDAADLHADLIRTRTKNDNTFRQLKHIRNYNPLIKIDWSLLVKKDNCSSPMLAGRPG